VTDEASGKKPRKPPEREDALRVPLDFDDAVKAALETRPPPDLKAKKKPKGRRSKASDSPGTA
jgi:hypothetical protein